MIVLTRPCDGVVDLVEDGVTGFLIDPDDPGALRRLLTELARDPRRADALRAQAREFAEAAFADIRAAWRCFLADLMHDLRPDAQYAPRRSGLC